MEANKEMRTSLIAAILIVIARETLITFLRIIGLGAWLPRVAMPKTRIERQDIYSIDGQLKVTNLPETYTISVRDTKSMLPTTGLGNQVIVTKEFIVSDLIRGDCIHYFIPGHSNFHRIAGIFEDNKGWFCICKGDNCPFPDPFAVRPNNIQAVMRAVMH